MKATVVLKNDLVEQAKKISGKSNLNGLLNTCLADWVARHSRKELERRLTREYRAGKAESQRLARYFAVVDKDGWPSPCKLQERLLPLKFFGPRRRTSDCADSKARPQLRSNCVPTIDFFGHCLSKTPIYVVARSSVGYYGSGRRNSPRVTLPSKEYCPLRDF